VTSNAGTISVCIIAQNNEDFIGRCLDSCVWADQIVLVDGGSNDATADIARQYGAEVYVRPYDYGSHQKNYCLARASGQWTFLLDSDETIPPELAAEVQEIARDLFPQHVAYKVPRRLIDHGRWVRCCGAHPDSTYRFFKTGHFVLRLHRVHADGVCRGSVGRLRNAIVHYSYSDYDDHVRRVARWTTLSALDLYERGLRPGYSYLFAKLVLTFWHEYLIRKGVLNGIPGLMASVVRAIESFSKYAKVWELATDTSSVDLKAEYERKQAADRDILADELQPEIIQHALD